MSSRRGGAGGRKGKNSKSNKPGGKGGALNSNSVVSDGVPDPYHNLQTPCSRLLEERCKEVWTIDDEESSALALPPSSSHERPDKRLGRMLRHHLLEKRRQEAIAGAHISFATTTTATSADSTSNNPSASATASTTPPKKKKKKKKKKANKQQADGATSTAADGATATADAQAGSGTTATTTAETTAAISCTVSQEDSLSSDMIMAVSAKEELRTSASSAATSATVATSTTSSIANDASATTSDNHHQNNKNNNNSAPTTNATANYSAAWTTPVDAYLDRLLVQQDQVQQRLENEQSIIANSTSSSDANTQNNNTKSSIPRTLESFVQYLNQKHANNTTANQNKGLVITQQEVEAVYQSIACDPCRHAMLQRLNQGNMQRQPVVLAGISFGNDNNRAPSFPRNHHNGLAIPVDNPALGTREDPTPSVDFDYVALEEGGNPIGAWMEAKADLQGIPYFHPQVTKASDVASSSVDSTLGSNNNHHKHANNKGSNNNKGEMSLATSSSSKSKQQQQQQHAPQLEWRFVSSVATRNQTLKDESSNKNATQTSDTVTANKPEKSSSNGVVDQNNTNSNSNFITVQDLEHILKNVMLPLSMSIDELLGAVTDLSEEEQRALRDRIQKLDMDINELIKNALKTIETHSAELHAIDQAANDENVELKAGPKYIEFNDLCHKLFVEIITEIALERTLWLSTEGEKTKVIRTTESWWNMFEHLTDSIIDAIFEVMRAVEEYETALQEVVADNSGKIPEMFLSKAHRLVFSGMLACKVEVVRNLVTAIQEAHHQLEDVWPISSSGANSAFRNNGDGLKVTFRRKWFAQQELCRTMALRQKREEATKKGSAINAKAKKDALQRHKVASSTTASSPITAEKWVETLDFHGVDLLLALIDLSICQPMPRLVEIREEQMVRCQKVLGRLALAANEVFAPLADRDRAKNHPNSFVLQDDNLRRRCQSLSAQIQKEEELQQQQQLLAAPGEDEPSVTEQKRTVATLTTDSIKLLRHLRKCVSDSHESKSPPPTLPLRLASCLGIKVRFQHVDMRDCSYSTLVNSMLLLQNRSNQQDPCMGEGSGMPRLTSVLLALFYGKLSEQCSEWHAELAEQELLTNMTESDSGHQAISGDPSSGSKKDGLPGRNGTAVNSGNQGKASKKTKKKQKKSAPATQSSTADGTPGSGQEASSGPQKIPERSPSSSSSTERQGAASAETAAAVNGHHQPDAAAITVDECLVAEETAGKKTKTKGNAMKENKINSKEVLEDTDNTEAQSPEKNDPEEISTVEVDKDMGVQDHLGVFDSAESFLVKRLTALFKEAAQDSSSVVII